MSQKTVHALQLIKPNYNGTNWAAAINNNFDKIDEYYTSLLNEVDGKIAQLTPSVGNVSVEGAGSDYKQYVIVGTIEQTDETRTLNATLTGLDDYTGSFKLYTQINFFDENGQGVYMQVVTNFNENNQMFSITIPNNNVPTVTVYCVLLVQISDTLSS